MGVGFDSQSEVNVVGRGGEGVFNFETDVNVGRSFKLTPKCQIFLYIAC